MSPATALMIAAGEGQAEVVKALLGAGADRGLRNQKRERATDVAKIAGNTALADVLK